ncbi:RelB/DinJ family addiction module antitoxin [Weissella muntiaci]|uniref:RelB/DinJ family addiction module antitoxin n=1 Tax=Weissella muntiaci TaxID=2508881 RepID=A0A6C2C3U9_9LACO|nr:type II toxin-antitoxin system RelB/DinJ family antitoxin [Weissella muntiaci]TYC48359.1 RelB/DinJ family addiction module antitoxin [Weissella muntiaci]
MKDVLVQIRIDKDIKTKTDEIFSRSGISTQNAIKVFLYLVAKNNKSPFSDLFR